MDERLSRQPFKLENASSNLVRAIEIRPCRLVRLRTPGSQPGNERVRIPPGTLRQGSQDPWRIVRETLREDEDEQRVENRGVHLGRKFGNLLQEALSSKGDCVGGGQPGSTTFDIGLLTDCPTCKGKYKTFWGTCTMCVAGLVPNKSGESVLFLVENFLQRPTGFTRKGEGE